MLNLASRQRLKLDAQLIDLAELSKSPIRAAEWEFALTWTADSVPQTVHVNEKTLREFNPSELRNISEWRFSLPPTVRGLTQIDARSRDGQQIVYVINVLPGYQLPDEHLPVFIAWLRFYQDLRRDYSVDGDLSILALITDQVLSLRADDQGDVLQQDIPVSVRQELADLFDKVLKAPLRRLVDEKQLVDPGEVQHLSVATIDYFARHPETWHSRAYLRPRPVKLLDDRSEEDFDVYENRFVLHFLEDLDVRLRGLIQRTKTVLDEMNVRLPETVFRQNLGLAEGDIDQLRQQRDQAHDELLSLQKLQATIQKVENAQVFSKVKSLTSATKANTTLLMHPVYGKLYRLYQEIHQKEYAHERVKWLDEAERADLQSAYRDYCLLLLTRALEECHFDANGASAENAGKVQLRFELREDPRAHITLGYFTTRAHQHVTREMIQLVFANTASPKSESISTVWLFPELMWWGDTGISAPDKSDALNEAYDRLKVLQRFLHGDAVPKETTSKGSKKKREDDRQAPQLPVTVLLIHPTPPGEFDEQLGYADLRLLLNQGDNFMSGASYDQFGGYQVGCLPIYPATGDAEFRSVSRLKRLIRIQLFGVGLHNLCWKCFHLAGTPRVRKGHKEYECRNSSCRLRWGEVVCAHCGHSYFKMKAPQSAVNRLDVDLGRSDSARAAVALSEAAEGQLAISSPCEDLDRLDDFWAICPYCGHCEKESKSHSCKRCQTRRQVPE